MAVFEEDYSPRICGDVSGDLLHRFVDNLGTPYMLDGATVAEMKLRIKPEGQIARDGAGSWYIVDASDGQAAYQWDAADVATAGITTIQATAIIDGSPRHFARREILFEEAL